MSVTVIIPTIAGREALCERTVAAYKAQSVDVLLVKGAPTAGEGWIAGARQTDADFVLLGVDDMEPHSGAIAAGTAAAADGIYPSPRLTLADGSLESCGTLGGGNHLAECPDGTLAYMSSVPIATRESWERIGEPLPIHYYADDHLGYMARRAGLRCEVVREYAFTHHVGTVGRQRMVDRAQQDRATFLEAVIQ